MSRTVLFAGGPLHGQTMAISNGAWNVYAQEPYSPSVTDLLAATDPFADPFAGQVCYAISKFAMCGRMILVGHLGTEPDEALVFEVITSDGAKAASVAAMPVRPV